MESEPSRDEIEGPPIGEHGTSQLTNAVSSAFTKGDTYIITDDNSYHDNSRHHYGDAHVTNNYTTTGDPLRVVMKQARDLLMEHVSHGSLHNSAQRGPDAPKCYPETRVAVQEENLSWIKHGDQDTNPKRILWLSGPAGSGKTAIAGTIADECYKEGMLAAGFFFSSFAGTPDRCSKWSFIATLVYQLIQNDSILGLKGEVLAAFDRDPLILKRNLDAQADALILHPFRTIAGRSDPQTWPQLVLIDGLDECGGDEDGERSERAIQMSKGDNHREILSTLVRASNDPSFPFRIIVASRPEQAIKRYFSSLPECSMKEVFLDAKYDPSADIELYLRAMLNKIGWDYHLADDWYQQAVRYDWGNHRTSDVPRYLAEKASEQFIYAATVIRYIQDGTNTPIEQLQHILSSPHRTGSTPFAALDALYTLILKTSPTPRLSVTWLLSINYLSWNSFGRIVPSWYVKAILESSPGETELRLGNLTSLIGLSSDDGETHFVVYHKSLLDFLGDPERSGELYIDYDSAVRPFLEDRIYQVLKDRGPQVPLPSNFLDVFPRLFCEWYTVYHTPRLQYDSSDVDWWASHLEEWTTLRLAFQLVHMECPWYRCHSACKVWRKGITRVCEAEGWRVPTWMELLQDRFKKITYVFGEGETRLCPPELVFTEASDTGTDTSSE